MLNTHSNRGIIVTSRGGFIGAGYTAAGIVINGPGANTACSPFLKLGQNEVLPHGSGKGGLKIGYDSISTGALPVASLDLNGKTETVNKAGGTLTGAATVNGDLAVTFAGGSYSASLAVSGMLAVSGTVRLAVPEGAGYPYSSTLFSYASADAASRAALASAITPSPASSGFRATVRVSETSAQLVIAPVGALVELR